MEESLERGDRLCIRKMEESSGQRGRSLESKVERKQGRQVA